MTHRPENVSNKASRQETHPQTTSEKRQQSEGFWKGSGQIVKNITVHNSTHRIAWKPGVMLKRLSLRAAN